MASNLQAFFKKYPSYERKWQSELQDIDFSKYQIRGDGDSLSLLEDGHLVDSKSLSFQDPETKSSERPKRILLVEGFGLGYLVRSTLESSLGKFENMVVVEPSAHRFLFALSKISIEDLLANDKIHFMVGMQPEESFSYFLQYLRVPEIAFRMDAYHIVKHPVLSERYKNEFEIIWDEWKAAQNQTRLHFGTIDDSLVGLKFVVENLDWIKRNPGIISLKDQFKGIPAVIVSTGPSLNKSLEDLRAIQNKALILSADASLNILLENGIEPHFVLSLERDLFSQRFFMKSSASRERLRTGLISYPFVPSESLKTYSGPQWVAYRDLGYFLYFEHEFPRGILSSSTSVAHFCLRLAHYLGCSSASLVGQDLAFDPDNLSSHAAGIVYEEWSKASSMQALLQRIKDEKLGHLIWVEGNFRPKVPTHSVYFSFMKEFSWEASQLPIPVYNSTEGGAKIPEVPWKKLSEIAADWKATEDLFAKISALRIIKRGEEGLLPGISQFLLELCDKFKTILALTEDPRAAVSLPEEKRNQTVAILRSAQTELYKDTRFVCFVVQNAGRELVEVENAWAVLPENAGYEAQMSLLKRWTETVMDVASRVQTLLTRAASEKKSDFLVSSNH